MRKSIRFNYFQPVLVPARAALRVEAGENEIDYGESTIWNMRHLLDFIEMGNITNWNCEAGGELAEIEPGSIMTRNISIKGFQLTKLRVDNIPAKKKLGKIKEDIMLNDDEYIGEFVSCFYDDQLSVLGVQSNKYGLTIRQVEEVLTNLRFNHCNAIGYEDGEEPSMVKLRPILSPDGLSDAINAKYIRKIKMRVSDFMHDGQLANEPLLGSARRLLAEFSGANIEITINVGRSTKESLDRELINNTLNLFANYHQNPTNVNKLNCEITKKDEDDSPVDIINLIEPRLTDVVSAEIQPRNTIAHEYLLDLILGKYSQRRGAIRSIIIPMEE